jgi:hypothetical protein
LLPSLSVPDGHEESPFEESLKEKKASEKYGRPSDQESNLGPAVSAFCGMQQLVWYVHTFFILQSNRDDRLRDQKTNTLHLGSKRHHYFTLFFNSIIDLERHSLSGPLHEMSFSSARDANTTATRGGTSSTIVERLQEHQEMARTHKCPSYCTSRLLPVHGRQLARHSQHLRLVLLLGSGRLFRPPLQLQILLLQGDHLGHQLGLRSAPLSGPEV